MTHCCPLQPSPFPGPSYEDTEAKPKSHKYVHTRAHTRPTERGHKAMGTWRGSAGPHRAQACPPHPLRGAGGPRGGWRGGLLLTPRTTPRPALPPPASPGLEMRQEGMGPRAAGHRAENHRVGWGKLRKLLEGPMVPPAWLPHSQWHRRTGPEGVAWGKGTGWGAGARCPEDTASGVESALGSP